MTAPTGLDKVISQEEQIQTVGSKMERVKSGYHQGSPWIYYPCLWLGIVLQIFMRRHQTLIGAENLAQIEQYRQQGYRIVLDFDHFSTADIPAPLCLFWDRGYHQLVRSMFFIIGLRWGEKFLGRGADRCYVVPEPLIPARPQRRDKESDEEITNRRQTWRQIIQVIKEYNNSSWKALGFAQSRRRITWASSQATRSRSGLMQKSMPGANQLWENGDVVFPIALEGTEGIIPIGKWLPRFWKPLLVIVGKPIIVDHEKNYPTANEVGRARARLHIDNAPISNPFIAGEYYEELAGLPLPKEYRRRLESS